MIGYIEGKVMSGDGINVLLLNNGVGYEIACSGSAYDALMSAGEGGVYTYLQVKEDGLALFGFSSNEEKELFLKLISVSGVGPKMGITVLSQMSGGDLASVIASGDIKRLCAVKGLGKKTAERIVLELADALSSPEFMQGMPQRTKKPSVDSDALLALTSLGFTRQESQKAIEEAQALGLNTSEKILSYALKHIR